MPRYPQPSATAPRRRRCSGNSCRINERMHRGEGGRAAQRRGDSCRGQPREQTRPRKSPVTVNNTPEPAPRRPHTPLRACAGCPPAGAHGCSRGTYGSGETILSGARRLELRGQASPMAFPPFPAESQPGHTVASHPASPCDTSRRSVVGSSQPATHLRRPEPPTPIVARGPGASLSTLPCLLQGPLPPTEQRPSSEPGRRRNSWTLIWETCFADPFPARLPGPARVRAAPQPFCGLAALLPKLCPIRAPALRLPYPTPTPMSLPQQFRCPRCPASLPLLGVPRTQLGASSPSAVSVPFTRRVSCPAGLVS